MITVPWTPKWYFDFRLAPLSLLSPQCCISPLPRLHLLLQAHFCSESKYLYLYRREKGPHSREKTKQVIKFTKLWIWNSTRDKTQFVLCKSSKSSSPYLNVQCLWKLNSGHNFKITSVGTLSFNILITFRKNLNFKIHDVDGNEHSLFMNISKIPLSVCCSLNNQPKIFWMLSFRTLGPVDVHAELHFFSAIAPQREKNWIAEHHSILLIVLYNAFISPWA